MDEAPGPNTRPRRVILRDGTPVLIRPIRPEDKAALQEGLARLSPRSRYRRFMSGVPTLSTHELEYLTEIDYVNHMAWVALDPSRPGQPGLGVARYVRLAGEPTVAEAAVAVVDSHQGRGLGTILLRALGVSAARCGIETFRAYVLESNAEVMGLLRALGARVAPEGAGALRVEVPVPPEVADLPATPSRRVLEAAAREAVQPRPLSLAPGREGPRD